MYCVWFFILVVVSNFGFAQKKFKIYHKDAFDGLQILADNEEFCPISADIHFNIENLTSSRGKRNLFIIPARTKSFLITDLKVKDRKLPMTFGYTSTYNLGNQSRSTHDGDFKYYLPFEKGQSYLLSQGYFGKSSHQNQNALDFKMPMGTKILAARGGTVVDVQEGFEKKCTDTDCAKYNNYIIIHHQDGSFAEYTHIQKNGAVVSIGDTIAISQHIGYSGDVGWATGPHLHFVVFYQRITKRESLRTKFLINDGNQAVELIEKKTYTRRY